MIASASGSTKPTICFPSPFTLTLPELATAAAASLIARGVDQVLQIGCGVWLEGEGTPNSTTAGWIGCAGATGRLLSFLATAAPAPADLPPEEAFLLLLLVVLEIELDEAVFL